MQLIGDCRIGYCTSGDDMIPSEEIVGCRKKRGKMVGEAEIWQGFIRSRG